METQITLKIKTLDNQITSLVVDPNNTVQQLKKEIQTQLNIPFDNQRLIYQGRVLENNKTLQDYKLQNDHVILLPGQPIQEEQIVQNQPQQQQQQQQTQGVNEFPEIDILSNILRTLRQHQYNRQNVRRMVQQQRSNGFNIDKQQSLEGIRQNYQTLKQLLDSQVKPEELKQEDLQCEYVNPFDPKKRKFQVGQWIDVKDTIDQWLEAQVQIVEQDRVFIHYNGWGNRWDEWIDTQSPRIATFRTYTVGSIVIQGIFFICINQEFLSPNPVSDPDCEVDKQEIDMHKFIFDIGHMMNQVTQSLIEFGRFENNKRIAEKQIQLQKQYQQMLMNKNKDINTEENILEMIKKEKELNEYEIKSSLVGSQLAPIFDRMGRMMTDLAPHLALMGQKTQKVNNNNQQQLLFQVPVTLTPNEMYQSQQNAPTLHSRLEIISNRLAILRMTEFIQQEDSDDDHIIVNSISFIIKYIMLIYLNILSIILYDFIHNQYNYYIKQMSLINRRKQNNKINKAKQSSDIRQQIPYIGEYNEAPSYTLDNKYLLTGYRINYDTLSLALKSMFHKHNETCNIWSHLLPLFLFLGLFIYSQISQIAPFISFMKESENHYSDIQLWPLQYCLLCAIILFTISTIYHTFFCVNKTLSCVLLRLDYGGICLVASGGVIPVIQYGFYCNQQIKDIYTIMIILLCILTFISSLFDYMHKEQFVIYKTLIYGLFFTFIFTPVFHLMMFSRYNLLGGHFHFNDTENYFLMMLIFLITGITTYATRFPERCFPKRFDIFINSHSIWHIFVVLSYSTSYLMSLNMYTIRENYKCT